MCPPPGKATRWCSAARPTNATAPAVLDQIAHNVRWGLIDNLHSVPEDCDQRNERWGWMGKRITLTPSV